MDALNPNHFSIAFGDAMRVQKVTLCGEDVSRRCYAFAAGVEGFVDVYVVEAGSPQQRLAICPQCGWNILRQVLHGNVETVVYPDRERRVV